jgi:hypothetical protein
MTDVEKVALWAGLIGSIVSTVLSVVAIWFAVHVNSRSEDVSDQTIRSLQKIESFVQKLSDDTSGLIKAAWDKMLGNMYRGEGTAAQASNASNAKEIASGLTAELKTEIEEKAKPDQGTTPSEIEQRVEKIIETWEKALEAQIASGRTSRRDRGTYAMYRFLKTLSPKARELLSRIRDYHLTRAQYRFLTESSLAPMVRELRRAGLLVPLEGNDRSGRKVAVYWFPSGLVPRIRQALMALGPAGPETRNEVDSALKAAGYDKPDPARGSDSESRQEQAG